MARRLRVSSLMPRALVLGSTGHIGAHVVRALLAEGHQVRAAYRREQFLSVLEGLPVERVQVDVECREEVGRALDGCDWVFHAAAYYPGFREARQRAVSRGVAATRRLLECLRRANPARVVFTSSASTIRRVPGRLATEADAEPWPLAEWRPLYATVKIAIEHEVRLACEAGMPVVIVNPSLCVGEYDARPFSGRLVLAFAKHHVPFYVDHAFHAIYTGDVGIGHVRAAERGRLGERYLLTCRGTTLQAFAALAAQAAGVPPPRIRVPYGAALGIALITEWLGWLTRSEPRIPRRAVQSMRDGQQFDGAKALRELALPQTPLEEAMARAVAWFSAQGYLPGGRGAGAPGAAASGAVAHRRRMELQ